MSNRESILSEKEAHEARVASLIATISALKGEAEVSNFLRDLCTWGELEAMAQRWEVAQLVDEGVSYLEIARRTEMCIRDRPSTCRSRFFGPSFMPRTRSE